MQSYSLAQQLVKRYGNNVEIIDFEKASKHNAYHAKMNVFQMMLFGKSESIMRDRFLDDLKLLPLSEMTLITDNYDEVYRYIEGRYDIIIVGSDAVWAYNKGLGLNNPYWLFGDKLQCEKFSYAASAFSLDLTTLSNEDKKYIGNCLKSFSYIGVRDLETENLVKMCLPNADVYRNCDPTVLLDKPKKDYVRKVFEKQQLNPRKKLVTVMMGRYEPIIYEVMKKIGHKDYQFVYLYGRTKAIERFLPSTPRLLCNLSPYEWYHLYGASYLNMTTYFHGTLLAMKSSVPTIAFDTCSIKGNYTSKVEQLMLDMNQSEFYNSYRKGIKKEEILNQVDFVLNNHERIETIINESMTMESRKSESFFEKLDMIAKL